MNTKIKPFQGLPANTTSRILVYYESTSSVHVALEREKQIKGWLRAKKIALIESMNPKWNDLSKEWFV